MVPETLKETPPPPAKATPIIESETERTVLRQWRQSDRSPFAALNSHPEVMSCFPTLLTRQESDVLAARCESQMQARGWGVWALELKASGDFIGFVGLNTPPAELPCSPCVEIAWRLAFEHWGKGLAREAAQEALRIGFETLGLDEIVSFMAEKNTRSRSLMERLSMRPSGTFLHPFLPTGHPLQSHCLYRLSRSRTQ